MKYEYAYFFVIAMARLKYDKKETRWYSSWNDFDRNNIHGPLFDQAAWVKKPNWVKVFSFSLSFLEKRKERKERRGERKPIPEIDLPTQWSPIFSRKRKTTPKFPYLGDAVLFYLIISFLS